MTKIYTFALHRKSQPATTETEAATTATDSRKSDAEIEAERIIQEARGTAERIVGTAQEQAQQQVGEQVARVLLEFNRSLTVSETELSRLVADSVRKILGAIPSPQLTAYVVRTALADLRSNHQVIMRVAPAERFSSAFAQLKLIPEFAEVIANIVSDPSLELGQCVIETRGAKIQIGIDQQIKALEEALSQANRNGS